MKYMSGSAAALWKSLLSLPEKKNSVSEGGSSISQQRLGAWRFVAGQLALTGLNALTGFMLVRGLGKSDYAVYSLVFSLLAIAVNASNMGLTSAVLGIGGRVWPDGVALRAVLNSAQWLRNCIGLWLAMPFAVYCLWQFPRIGLGIAETTALTALVLIAAWVQMQTNFYAIALQLGQLVGLLLRNELLAAGLKMAGVLVLLWVGTPLWVIVGWIVLCLGLIYIWHTQASRPLLAIHPHKDAAYLREMRHMARANAVRTLYWSFEGQITILLCAWFSSTEQLAEVGALGRLSVLFGIFHAFVANYTLPDLAKARTGQRVMRQAVRTLGAALLLISPVLVWAVLHPSSLLWILGEQYAGLSEHLLPFLIASATGQWAAVVYQMCTARAWLALNRFYVPLVLPLQTFLIFILDLSRMENVIFFSWVNNIFFLLFNVAMFMLSWRKERWE